MFLSASKLYNIASYCINFRQSELYCIVKDYIAIVALFREGTYVLLQSARFRSGHLQKIEMNFFV